MGRTRVQFSLVYYELARRLLLKQDVPLIAQAMGIPEPTVQRVMRKPAFQAVLQQIQDKTYATVDQHLTSQARNLREEFETAAYASFDRLTHLLAKAESESVQMNVAQDLLDRAGYAKVQKVEAVETLKVDPITADVLVTALKKEEEGRRLLAQKVDLTKTASETEHPVARRLREAQDEPHTTLVPPTPSDDNES